MIRYGRRDLGHDPLAHVTEGEGGAPTQPGSSHDDELALVY
jgi:hypothetical protein